MMGETAKCPSRTGHGWVGSDARGWECVKCGATRSAPSAIKPIPSSDKPSDAELVKRLLGFAGDCEAEATSLISPYSAELLTRRAQALRLAASRLSVPREGVTLEARVRAACNSCDDEVLSECKYPNCEECDAPRMVKAALMVGVTGGCDPECNLGPEYCSCAAPLPKSPA